MSKYTVTIISDLAELMPTFLNNRRKELIEMQKICQNGDFYSLMEKSHAIRGVLGSYGFERAYRLASEVEKLAEKAQNNSSCQQPLLNALTDLSDSITNIEIRYEDEVENV